MIKFEWIPGRMTKPEITMAYARMEELIPEISMAAVASIYEYGRLCGIDPDDIDSVNELNNIRRTVAQIISNEQMVFNYKEYCQEVDEK